MILGGAHTIYGKKVIENLELPTITYENLLQDISFNLGYALGAVQVNKTDNTHLAQEMFYKSCLFATRDLLYSKTKKLAITYKEIYESSLNLNLEEEYKELLEYAYKIRENLIDKIPEKLYFKNISYINKYILNEIKSQR